MSWLRKCGFKDPVQATKECEARSFTEKYSFALSRLRTGCFSNTSLIKVALAGLLDSP